MVAVDRGTCLSETSVDYVPALVSEEKRPPPVEESWAETTSELAAMMATCVNFMLKELKWRLI